MTEFHAFQFLSLILISILAWILPKNWQLNAVSSITMLLLGWFSLESLALLTVSSLVVYFGAHSSKKTGVLVPLLISYCGVQYLLLDILQLYGDKSWQTISFIGLAYYTCRNIHYIIEVFSGRIKPELVAFWHYQFFWPVMVTGPINRYQNFHRQCQRRRWDPVNASLSLHRIVIGYAKVVILANYIVAETLLDVINAETSTLVINNFLISANDWLYLYLQFSGWSDIAIGFSLLMGIKIEENFNKPYLATNLIEFWQRWHMTLSNWCRDYVFTPVLAVSRKPFLAVIIAMSTMGLWHEVSLYYLLWGIYHASGIAICRIFQSWEGKHAFDNKYFRHLSRVLTFAFIIAGAPIISTVEKILMGIKF